MVFWAHDAFGKMFGEAAAFRALTLCCAQLAAEILRRGFMQPISIYQAQIPHVAACRVQELVEDHVGRFGLEQDGGGMDGHSLMGVQSHVAAVQLQFCSAHEQTVSQTAPDVHQVR